MLGHEISRKCEKGEARAKEGLDLQEEQPISPATNHFSKYTRGGC